nr:Stp1/IreP family PP2C-type Ser/Thr phosphatase [Parvibium lacunae]
MRLNVDLDIAYATDSGKLRPHNEDSVAISTEYGLAILADGMGGYNAGEVASGMATAVLKNDLEADLARWHKELYRGRGEKLTALLQARIARANSAIYQASQSQPQYAGMGTTLVMGIFRGETVTLAHIGDSRAYRLRGEVWQQLTRDHSLLQEQLDAGLITPEQARQSHNKNLVTRALGIDSAVIPDIQQMQTEAGDIYLFCSDGLSDMVPEEVIIETIQGLGMNLAATAQQLVQAANDYGGRDNVSVVLVKIQPHSTASFNLFSRFFNWLK